MRYEVKTADGLITGHPHRTSAMVKLGRIAESHYQQTGKITRVSEPLVGTFLVHWGRDDEGPDMFLRTIAVAYQADS